MYRFSNEVVTTFEGVDFYAIYNIDAQIVGYSQSHREIPKIVYIDGNRDTYIFDACILTKGEIFGGILRGGELSGAKISGGELNGGVLYGGHLYNGVFNSGSLFSGAIKGGEFNGALIYNGEIWGGTYNSKVVILDGVWGGGVYNETPLQLRTDLHFAYIQFPHGTTPYMLSIGCEIHPLEEYDLTEILARIDQTHLLEEYSAYVDIFKKKYA